MAGYMALFFGTATSFAWLSSTPSSADLLPCCCFLSGYSYASGIAHSHSIPILEFSHQSGHIAAAVYSSGQSFSFFDKTPFISFHISGGTTEALLTKFDKSTYRCEIICGKELDALSAKSTKKLPVCVSFKDGYFSMSGLENKVQKFLSDGEANEDIAMFIFGSIASAIEKSSLVLREKYGDMPILYAGGVMSNSVIRQKLSKLPNVYFASPDLSCDNACGTALLAYKFYNK